MEKDIMLVCEYCGINFITDKAHPYQKYCGWRCRNQTFKEKNPEKVKLSKQRERIKHAVRYQEMNALYKDRRRFGGNKRRAMERDFFTCLNCGRQYPNVNLVVHHVDGSKNNHILLNLVTLCRSCHCTIHHS